MVPWETFGIMARVVQDLPPDLRLTCGAKVNTTIQNVATDTEWDKLIHVGSWMKTAMNYALADNPVIPYKKYDEKKVDYLGKKRERIQHHRPTHWKRISTTYLFEFMICMSKIRKEANAVPYDENTRHTEYSERFYEDRLPLIKKN